MSEVSSRSLAKKTETVSYRIRADLKSALEDEAKRLGINTNALVSQIFSRHISWGRYVGQLKFIPVSKDFLRLVFESLSQEQVENIARLLGESVAHEELFFTKEYISSLLETAIGKKVNFEAMSPNSVTFTFEDYPKDWRKNESNNTGLNNNLHRSNDPEKVMQE